MKKHPAQGGLARRLESSEYLALALIVTVWIVILVWLPPAARQGDVLRFNQIAHGGTPYVDQPVEYPPLETLLVLLLGSSSLSGTVLLVSAVNAIATAASWLLIRTHWSRGVGTTFLWFALPLQVFMPFRLDAVPVALTLAAIVLADAHREKTSGLLWAGAILFKVWPVVLLPMLFIRRRVTALITAVTGLAVGCAAWVSLSGFDAIRQVESFRRATGWHIESVFGVIDSLVTGSPVRVEAGATRIGDIEGWEIFVLRLVTLLGISLVWVLARRRSVDLAGGPALAAVSILIVLSPVASPQYVVWLLPWAAIVASERRRLDTWILTLGASVSAASVFAVYWGDPYALNELLLLASVRAVCIVGLAGIGLTHRAVHSSQDPTLVRSSVMQPAANIADG